MKTINKIKLILLLSIAVLMSGCGVNVIPTLVSKDVSFGFVSVAGLENKYAYAGIQTIDLTSLVKQEELDQINSVTIEEFALTLNSNYENSVTKSKQLERIFIAFYIVNPNASDDQALSDIATNSLGGSALTQGYANLIVRTGSSEMLTPDVTKTLFVSSDNNIKIKDYIKDGKLRIGTLLFNLNDDFHDDFFTFIASAKTTVQLEL